MYLVCRALCCFVIRNSDSFICPVSWSWHGLQCWVEQVSDLHFVMVGDR